MSSIYQFSYISYLHLRGRSFAGFGASTRILLNQPYTSRGFQESVRDDWTKQENHKPLSDWPTLRVPDKCMTHPLCHCAETDNPYGEGNGSAGLMEKYNG